MNPSMTEQDARTFAGYSVANASHVKHSLACGCEPYQDVFTYRRWQAQGYQVQRGAKAIKLPVIIHKTVTEEQDGETKEKNIRLLRTVVVKVPGKAAVFCRHQVKQTQGTLLQQPEPQQRAEVVATPVQPVIPPAPTPFLTTVMSTWRDL